MTDLLTPLEPPAPSSVEVLERRAALARAGRSGFLVAALVAVVGSVRPGVGLALVNFSMLIIVARLVGIRTAAGRWCAVWSLASAVLVIRDNSWLAISVIATSLLVSAMSLGAHATGQSAIDFAPTRLLRRGPAAESGLFRVDYFSGRIGPVVRGLILATPVVLVFGALLASADEVFATLVSAFNVEVDSSFNDRLKVFAVCAGLMVPGFVLAADVRASTEAAVKARLGAVEASIVLGSVNVLFGVFVILRSISVGDQLPDELFRGDVRAGFFQLLFVAALTVMLILALIRYGAEAMKSARIRALALGVIGLAAVIDGLAMIRIHQYVSQSFNTPLRFWSFAFGMWLIVVLAITALRLTSFAAGARWFSAAFVSSWMVFIVGMAIANPDVQIAEHNFANPPIGEDQYISVKPLIWLSEDATTVIVENIDALRPLPNDRYERMVDHLCSAEDDSSWRELHIARANAAKPRVALCSGDD